MQKQWELLELETVPVAVQHDYCVGMDKDMTNSLVEYLLAGSRKKDDLIEMLKSQISELTELVRQQKESMASMSEMQSRMQSESSLMRKENREHQSTIRTLREQLEYAKESRFGDKRQKLRRSSSSKDKNTDKDGPAGGSCGGGEDREQGAENFSGAGLKECNSGGETGSSSGSETEEHPALRE